MDDIDMDTPGSGSPLSDLDSDEFTEKYGRRSRSGSRDSTISASSEASVSHSPSTPRHRDMPPAKRRKTGASSYDHATPQSGSTIIPPRSPTGSISSDTSGSVPTSPSFAHLGPTHPLTSAFAAAQANPDNPEMADYTQVSTCQWTGCANPDQGNMDNLVTHINDVHIVPRQKKYYCEWEGCSRKGSAHTSAYALKAHMRSHTKEKPFLCALPECDRSFTRSDALAKHMRTVHETEALRPSDPVPRGHTGGISNGVGSTNGTGTLKRIKLVMGTNANGQKRPSVMGELPPLPTRFIPSHNRSNSSSDEPNNLTQEELLASAIDIDTLPFPTPIPAEYWPSDIWDNLDTTERVLPPSQLFRLLNRQLNWATEENEMLTAELRDLRMRVEAVDGSVNNRGAGDDKGAEENRRLEWFQTEYLLDEVLRREVSVVKKMFGVSGSAQEGSAWEALEEMKELVTTKMATRSRPLVQNDH